ncbi:MAG: MarR family winged helix-turn-helix transcriptional regulator [Oceanicaulis sp.]
MSEERARLTPSGAAEAGLPGDPALFKAMSEIAMIAHLSDILFARLLPDGLTPAQFGVLNRLVRLRRLETISELSRAFQVAQPTMTSTVKKLAAKGLVVLRPDPKDRRARRIDITAEGESARAAGIAALAPVREEVAREAPELDFEALLPALTAIRVFLDARR